MVIKVCVFVYYCMVLARRTRQFYASLSNSKFYPFSVKSTTSQDQLEDNNDIIESVFADEIPGDINYMVAEELTDISHNIHEEINCDLTEGHYIEEEQPQDEELHTEELMMVQPQPPPPPVVPQGPLIYLQKLKKVKKPKKAKHRPTGQIQQSMREFLVAKNTN